MKTKKNLILLCFFNAVLLFGQTPNWAWAKGGGGNTSASYGNDKGNNLITDANGNVYSIGNFQSTQLVLGSYTLTNSVNAGDSADVFIVKYNATGNVLWAKSVTGIGNESGLGITVDAANNIYITGGFASTSITFDTKTITNTTNGTDDIFIAKYSAAGNIIWAKSYGGTNDEFGNAIITDAMNNIYITGSFKSQSFAIGTYTLTNDSTLYSNMFMAKYDSSGNVLFAESIGKSCTISYTGSNLVSDVNNNVYITGCYTNPKTIIGSDTLINKGGEDIFIVKYNSSGIPLWARCAGGSAVDEANSIAIDAGGNTYISGYFESQPLIIGNDTLTTINIYDIFIAKYDISGNVLWARSLGTINPNGITHGPSIATDLFGGIYVVGGFINQTPALVFGNDTLFNAGPGNDDIFIGKFNTSGLSQWGKISSGLCNDWDQITGVTTDLYGNIFVTGFYASHSIVFGNDSLNNLNHYYYYTAIDYFTAKLGQAGVGIEEINSSNNTTTIYPNPNTGDFNISSLRNIEEIKITDMLGQIVYENKCNEQKMKLQIEKGGIYFVTIISDKQISTHKLIVTK